MRIGAACLERDQKLLLGKSLLQGAVQLANKPFNWPHMHHDRTPPDIDATLAQVLMGQLLRVLHPLAFRLIPVLCCSRSCNLQHRRHQDQLLINQ